MELKSRQESGFRFLRRLEVSKVIGIILYQLLDLFMCHPAEETTIENGTDFNQRKLKSPKPFSSSSNSMSAAGFDYNSQNLVLLPKLKRTNFHVPEYVSSTEWLRSQSKLSKQIIGLVK